MPDQPQHPPKPAAFLVVCQPGTPETELAALRTAMRMWPQVASIQPVGSDPAHQAVMASAEQRAKREIREEWLPVWEQVQREFRERMDAATEEFASLAGTAGEAPSVSAQVQAVPAPRGSGSGPQHAWREEREPRGRAAR